MSLFEHDGFDLDAYLDRIGVDGATRPDLATLEQIALQHPSAIPFESLNPLLRRPVLLDAASLQQKLIRDQRGGWCYEHNLLLGAALTTIGFQVSGLSGRVLYGVAPGVVRSRTHMALHVELNGRALIVDAGFGGLTLTGVLRLEADIEQPTPHEPFRLTPSGGGYQVEARIAGQWHALYEFDLQPQKLPDYEMANWYLCHHPQSHFLSGLMAARVSGDRRYALRNNELATHHRDGFTERRARASGAEIRKTLEQRFGIRVPDGRDVDETFERLVTGTLATMTRS